MWRAMQSEFFKPDLMQTDRQYSTRLLRNTNPGFALVVTLSLMILLTVIAVGLLSLSAISLRQSAQTDPLAVAQANARMALMLAIGELQHSLGPDTRVSANAKILEKSGVSISDPLEQITGVWEAWRPSADSTAGSPRPATQRKPRISISQKLAHSFNPSNWSNHPAPPCPVCRRKKSLLKARPVPKDP